ncbi:hypothetical protein KQI63_11010 [bacterium]|nr:hypothetical protein [bacterium]
MGRKGTITIVSIVLVFLATTAKGEDVPWEADSLGRMKIELRIASGGWPSFFPGIVKEYEERFGAYPGVMIFKDLKLDPDLELREREIRFTAKFQRYGGRLKPPVPAYLTMDWGDIKPYFWWKKESAKTGEVVYEKVKMGVDSTSVGDTYPNYKWEYSFEFPAETLKIPDDDSAWLVSLGCWESPPPEGKLIAIDGPLPIVYSPVETALDTYLIAESAMNWKVGTYWIRYSKEINLEILKSYPHSQTILSNLMGFYTAEKNCDSLKWAARKYVVSLRDSLDPWQEKQFPWNRMGFVDEVTHVENEIKKSLEAVCGDTVLWEE